MRTTLMLRATEAKEILGTYLGVPADSIHFFCKEDGTLSITARVDSDLQPISLKDPVATGRNLYPVTLETKVLRSAAVSADFLRAAYSDRANETD